jgi:homocysteine S-methyltransferase
MERVAAGDLVVIDGGTGTEIQRRGGAMDDATWCAEANLQRPDLVREVHRAYLEAGAELIIANTFATSPLLFATLGRDDEVAAIDRAAVRLAREVAAATGGGAAVAGSISTMQPVVAGDDRTDRSHTWTEDDVRERYRRRPALGRGRRRRPSSWR